VSKQTEQVKKNGRATKSSMLHARVSQELRTKIERYAADHDMPVSHVMVRAVETLISQDNAGTGGPPLQTHHIPTRILEVERHFGLSVLESVTSLKDFGIRTVHDLASPEPLLKGMNANSLKVFAETYEVCLDWLLTGEGPVYKPTHRTWLLRERECQAHSKPVPRQAPQSRVVCCQQEQPQPR
jgi:hypothetical protein